MDPIVDIKFDGVGQLKYQRESGIALNLWQNVISEGIDPPAPIVPPVPQESGTYTSTDMTPRTFPTGSEWLIDEVGTCHYLFGCGWWLLEELAIASNMKITVLQGCPLSVPYAGSPAHYPCYTSGGGLTADCKYPAIDGQLDVEKMKAIIDRFLEICCALIPGQEWKDISNESEIRVGSDVSSTLGSRYISVGQWNRHIQIDDSQHHRFDDSAYPHFHMKWDKK